MALNRSNGVFSPTMFHPTVYDTGPIGHPVREEEDGFDFYRHAKREDEDILEFILTVTTSGILEE